MEQTEQVRVLDRATYKKIKQMSREEMQNFLTRYYKGIVADTTSLELVDFDITEILADIKQIPGIGEKRFAEIESVLRKHLLPNEQ